MNNAILEQHTLHNLQDICSKLVLLGEHLRAKPLPMSIRRIKPTVKYGNKQLEMAKRKDLIIKLRNNGKTWREIGCAVFLAPSYVKQIYEGKVPS